MCHGWRNSLWIALICCASLACSSSDSTTSNGTTRTDGQVTPVAGTKDSSAALVPAGPDDDTGNTRVSDKPGKSRTKALADDDNPFSDAAEESPVEKGAARKSLAGKWILVLTRPGENGFFDFHAGLVDITPDKQDGLPAKWSAQTGVLPPAQLSAAEISGSQITLTFEVEAMKLDFRGKLRDGVVYGNALFGNCLPARLLPTKATSLEDFNTSPAATDFGALNQVFKTEDRQKAIKGYQSFIAKHPDSPLSMMAWESLILTSALLPESVEKVESLTTDYQKAMAPWGTRLQQAATGNTAIILAQTQFDTDFSLKQIAAADKALTDETLIELKDQMKSAREGVQTVQALKLVQGDDAERGKKAFDFLTKIRQKTPFNPAVTHGMAQYLKKTRQTDAALELFAELATLPQMESYLTAYLKQKGDEKPELPSETLAKLWEAKNGGTDGLNEFKDSIYRKQLVSFAEKSSESDVTPGGRLLLCELFTGSSCPPCVGADVATAALEATFPKSQVLVIRYHQHIPGPDPLTNADGENRFTDYYRLQATPIVVLNGTPINNVGGYLPNAPEIYRGLKTLAEKKLTDKAPVKVRLLSTIVKGTLLIASDVQGLDQLDEKIQDELHLRVLIVEDEIPFAARNGVKHHEMIVRRMIGGPDGTGVKDGKLEVKASIPLAELKEQIADYLKKYEEGESIDFPSKPLDLQHLHVVAFVQNDETREVLQTIAVSVSASGSTNKNEITPTSAKAPPRTSSTKSKSAE